MAKKKEAKPERLNITLTPVEAERFNAYIINIGKKQGRVPPAIRTKIVRAALDEWLKNHENELDIDWEE